MNRKKLIVGLASIAIVTLLSTWTRHYVDAGWIDPDQMSAQTNRLLALPKQIGDWVSNEEHDLPENAKRILRCHGFVNRTYWNAQTGATVSVAILYGPRGPIAVHTPEICYSGVGTKLIGERRSLEIKTEDSADWFWMTQFSRGVDPTPSLEVWYAWSDGGPWIAAEQPRYWMTGSLFKIQLAGEPAKNSNAESDCKNFLRALMPVLRKQLHPS